MRVGGVGLAVVFFNLFCVLRTWRLMGASVFLLLALSISLGANYGLVVVVNRMVLGHFSWKRPLKDFDNPSSMDIHGRWIRRFSRASYVSLCNEFWPVFPLTVCRLPVGAGFLSPPLPPPPWLEVLYHFDSQEELAVLIDHLQDLGPPALMRRP